MVGSKMVCIYGPAGRCLASTYCSPDERAVDVSKVISQSPSGSLGQLNELFVPIDGVQRAANVVGCFGAAFLLNPVRKLHDGCFKGELVFVDFGQQGRGQVRVRHRCSSLE